MGRIFLGKGKFKKPTQKRKPKSTAQKALTIARSLQSKVQPELKHYDETNGQGPTSAGQVVSIIRGIALGDTDTTLEGNQFYLKGIYVRWVATINGAATNTHVRFNLIQDLRPLAAGPAWTDIFTNNNVNAMLNLTTWSGRFKPLKTVNFVLNGDMPSRTGGFYVKVNKLIKFNSTAIPIMNDLYLCSVSNEATNPPVVSFQSRLRYYDN